MRQSKGEGRREKEKATKPRCKDRQRDKEKICTEKEEQNREGTKGQKGQAGDQWRVAARAKSVCASSTANTGTRDTEANWGGTAAEMACWRRVRERRPVR